jgi:hypothetical protein
MRNHFTNCNNTRGRSGLGFPAAGVFNDLGIRMSEAGNNRGFDLLVVLSI